MRGVGGDSVDVWRGKVGFTTTGERGRVDCTVILIAGETETLLGPTVP